MATPDRSEASLPQLAARAQLGDRSALETLLRRLAEQLRPHIEQLTADGDQADDVLQEVLVRVARKLSTLREHAWVRAWAYRIATREAMRLAKQERRAVFMSLDAAVDVPVSESIDEPAFDAEALAHVTTDMASLPKASEVVLRLHYLHGLTQPEVAEALSIPLGTVKSRLAYGLQLLRTRLVDSSDHG